MNYSKPWRGIDFADTADICLMPVERLVRYYFLSSNRIGLCQEAHLEILWRPQRDVAETVLGPCFVRAGPELAGDEVRDDALAIIHWRMEEGGYQNEY